MTTDLDARADHVLDYWIATPSSDEWGKVRKIWFGGGPAVDEEIRTRFADLHARACAGELDHWQQDARRCLALLVLLDQFSRNLYRGTAGAFAADPKARAVAHDALERGLDAAVLPIQRWFFYLPFEHSEDLGDQRRALAAFSALPEVEGGRALAVEYAQKHLDVIARFGRFPHRNEMLGRPSTAEETKWLAEGGARFG